MAVLSTSGRSWPNWRAFSGEIESDLRAGHQVYCEDMRARYWRDADGDLQRLLEAVVLDEVA